MANLFDYLEWRGDVGLSASGFNSVDSLILSVLSYIPFDGIVSAEIDRNGISIADAAELFADSDTAEAAIRNEEDVRLLSALAASDRFGDMRLTGYVNSIDLTAEKQFSAVTILLGRGRTYVAFRGTDLSLVGWKEDFNMSFRCPVPSQEAAAVYLEQVAARLRGKLYVGGHSKGGNLAVYASVFAKRRTRKRILAVYNNDGPGVSSSILERDEFREMQDRIFAFIPQSSIIGMLLEHAERYTIVHSDQSGLMQHDPYSWSVLGTDFVRMQSVTNESVFIDQTVKEWIAGMTLEQREHFVDVLYRVIGGTEARTLPELTKDWLKSAMALGKSFKDVDEPTKKALIETLGLLFKAARNNLDVFRHAREEKKR
ncbi:MAG: hypothetical protein CVV47_09390 [Spirochaetae bacterium HGW-Spirochaetae-3]|jgi:hypothetical protein|nr:MAG: hypothetical protein CVV47_09390 [Spirochaetae bacterium HGW-Spirochaetae-3]